jgi:hypothetical protein
MKDNMPFDTKKLWKNMLDTHAIKMQMMLDQYMYENSKLNRTGHLLLLNTLLEFESLPIGKPHPPPGSSPNSSK